MRQKKISGSSIRNTWPINPVTRVHDNDPRKNKKQERQNARKLVKKELNTLIRDNEL